MTPEQRELSARFEAHLRGWTFISLFITSAGEHLIEVNKPMVSGRPMEPALDPTTPEGAWEAVELLDMGCGWRIHGLTKKKYWFAFIGSAFNTEGEGDSPITAVTAAWLAAAEEWSKK